MENNGVGVGEPPGIHCYLSTTSIFFFFFYTTPLGLWDLSFPTRDQTVLTAMKAQVLTTGPPRNSPSTTTVIISGDFFAFPLLPGHSPANQPW